MMQSALLGALLLLGAGVAVAESVQATTTDPTVLESPAEHLQWLRNLRNGNRRVKRSKNNVFGPVRTTRTNRRGKAKKGRKGGKSGSERNPFSFATTPAPISSSPISVPTNPAPVTSPVSVPTNASPVTSPPSSSFNSLLLAMGKGKGKSKSSKGESGGTGYSYGSEGSKKQRGGDESGKKGSSKGKKKQHEFCDQFEFDVDNRRRNLQFEGYGCATNIIDIASYMPELSDFVSLLATAGLSDVFSCGGPFTVLAPTNGAFDGIDFSRFTQQDLETFLLNHIFPGVYLDKDFQNGYVETLAGNYVSISTHPLSFNSASALDTDVLSCNGVLFPTNAAVVGVADDFDVCDLLDVNWSTMGNEDCEPSMLDGLRADPNLSMAFGLLQRAGLTGILSCGGDLTFLAPPNSAISALDPYTIEYLIAPQNVDLLRSNLLYHMLPGRIMSNDFQRGSMATLFPGYSVLVDTDPLAFDNAMATSVNNSFCNGVYHVLDSALEPFGSLDQFVYDQLNPDTNTDIVDGNLVSLECSLYDFGGDPNTTSCSPNLLDQARNVSDLEFFVQLIDYANLTTLFDCPGPFTGVFPNNDAIAALGRELVGNLTQPGNLPLLQNILLNHILPGNLTSSDFQNGDSATLAHNSTVTVTRDPSTNNVTFDNVTALMLDEVQSCNGVAHVIGGVLLTDVRDAAATPTAAPAQGPVSNGPQGTGRVTINRFYMSYVTTSGQAPSAEQYDTLRSATSAYYNSLFAGKIPGFVGIEMDVDFTLSGNAVTLPYPRFNIYIEFEKAEAIFTGDQQNPTGDEMLRQMVAGMNEDFLINTVRKIANTPFASVNEGWVAYTSD